MRKFILFGLFLLSNLMMQAQHAGMLFGLNAEKKLCKIDPATGEISVLSENSLTNGNVLLAPGAVDTDGGRFFFLDTENKLVIADLIDGSIINSFSISAGNNGALAYHCSKDRLYFFASDFLLEIDPANGSSTVVLDFSLPISQFSRNSQTLDEMNNRLFNLNTGSSTPRLFTVGLEDGSDKLDAVSGSLGIDHLVYACHENRLFGLEGNLLKSIHPDNLSLEEVATIPSLTGVIDGTRSFNNKDGLYYVIGTDDNEMQRLFTINTLNGNFSSSQPLSESLTNLAFANPCTATSNFRVDNLCSDDPIEFSNFSIGDRFTWNFGDPDSGDENTSTDFDASHLYSGPGSYTVELRVRTCTDRDFSSRQIRLIEPPENILETLYEKCRTDAVTISAANPQIDSYEWSTGATTDTIEVTEAGFYSVEATISDCVKTYETEVSNMPCPCRPDVPNAFTPNNDQTNDTFRPAFIEDYCEVLAFRMKIFNRWGQLVYETDDSMQPWDGEHNGQPAPSDVYVWVIEFSYIDKDSGEQGELEKRSGDVALIR